ncbi:SfnB family sulfur acquisition oxidoreductase [Taklimakanibacter deserti]|uniref:SfnB family sulfur acquisition oxidoreductase n=1 Tax=Taklimakanibacter deserti TaxID=2267839 RepID=UPI000E651874
MTVQLATAARDPALEFRIPAPRQQAARIIRSDDEAISVAHEVAAHLAKGAAERDRDRRLPYEEMDLLSDAGLLAITVPREFGGAEVKAGTLAEVMAIISAADGSIGQIPQNHFFMLEALRLVGTPEQKHFFYKGVLAGERLGNALSELGTKTAQDHATKISKDGESFRLNGRKFYSTGVLFAHWIAVVANNDEGKSTLSIIPRDSEGITIVDDWSGFGQRTTGSGTTILENVPVHPFSVLPFHQLFETPSSMGPHAQIMHAAVDQGIARGALEETIRFVRQYTRPWKESGVEHGYEDPHIIAEVGQVKIAVDAADALLARAGDFVDETVDNPTVDTVAAASIAVAEAKVAATDASLLAGSKLIELGGSRSTLAEFNLDRYWRNARTHTVHDPVRWKYRVIGNYWLNGVNPPRHGAV